VAVEFVIVVVGVFMGLQVQDWNEIRKERLEEHVLLLRLYEETLGLIEAQREELKGLGERADVLMGVNPVLYSQKPSRIISDEECTTIAGSHVLRRPPDELPVLDEMLSAGRFDVLQDKAIKQQLRSYVLFRERGRAYYQEATNELFRLHSRFPDLIKVIRVPTGTGFVSRWGNGLVGEGFKFALVCDAEKMRASTAFLNEYVDNLSRIGSIINFTEQRQDHLEELKTALTATLGAAAIAGAPE